MRLHGWHDAVIKPAIGGTARLALHVGDCDPDAAQRHLDGMLAHEDALVQRFIPSILSTGETSVIAIGGVITHAVQKRAPGTTGEFKPSSGGASSWSTSAGPSRRPPDAALEPVRPTPLYARIDLVEATRGELHVIELELVEPELFFRLAPRAATRMAQLLAHHEPCRDIMP